jgi:uncharacterized protein (TIGR02996 family)
MSRFLNALLVRLAQGFSAAGRAAKLAERTERRRQAGEKTRQRLQLEEPFLEAIRAEPDDDTARLIFADWLEERSDPRAEFIRVQCELACTGEEGPHIAELRKRERTLLSLHETRWLGPFRRRATSWQFRRGFIEKITIDARTFLNDAARLFRWAPLREVGFQEAFEHRSELAASPFLAKLTTVDLSWNRIGNEGADSLAQSPYVGGLTKLHLDTCGIEDVGAQRLAASPYLGRLTMLSFQNAFGRDDIDDSDNRIGDTGAEALAASIYLGRLTTLDLTGNPIGDRGKQLLRQRFGDRVLLDETPNCQDIG